MSDTVSKVEVITAVARRRRLSIERKLALVAETMRGQKNRSCCRARRFPEIPVKRVTQTLGVARSNVLERRNNARPPSRPQERPGDIELAGAIRRPVDAR